jgi:hypothetical protein
MGLLQEDFKRLKLGDIRVPLHDIVRNSSKCFCVRTSSFPHTFSAADACAAQVDAVFEDHQVLDLKKFENVVDKIKRELLPCSQTLMGSTLDESRYIFGHFSPWERI